MFDKLEAELAKAVMSIPASIGFDFGTGFAGTITNMNKNSMLIFNN